MKKWWKDRRANRRKKERMAERN